MPGPTSRAPAPARPLYVAPAAPEPPAAWMLDVHLRWDVNAQHGTVWGAAWTDDGEELLDLPSVELAGEDVHDDVVELLRGLWVDSQRIARAQSLIARDGSA